MKDKSVNEIFRDLVGRVAERYGKNVSFLFGDWGYISNTLVKWGNDSETSRLKYPIICLLSPYEEDRTDVNSKVSLEFIIMVNTIKSYDNETRERRSFEEVLRPVYLIFIDEISKEPLFVRSYNGVVLHRYTENYRYGRLGVMAEDGKPFRDFIDAIEIKQMDLTIKKTKCYGNRL